MNQEKKTSMIKFKVDKFLIFCCKISYYKPFMFIIFVTTERLSTYFFNWNIVDSENCVQFVYTA